MLYNNVFFFVLFTAFIDITPNGVVSFTSPLYDGATSDQSRLNMTRARSLIELMEDGEEIMYNRGFALDAKHSHPTFVHPLLLQGKPQLSPTKVIETHIIAGRGIHVEPCIRRIKNYNFLNGVIPIKSNYLLNFWFYICTVFTIFDGPLVKII